MIALSFFLFLYILLKKMNASYILIKNNGKNNTMIII